MIFQCKAFQSPGFVLHFKYLIQKFKLSLRETGIYYQDFESFQSLSLHKFLLNFRATMIKTTIDTSPTYSYDASVKKILIKLNPYFGRGSLFISYWHI